VLLALSAGVFGAAQAAGPDSPLYGVHRWQEGIQAQFSQSQADRTSLHLQFANEALLALNSAVQSGDGAAYSTALATLRSETAAAVMALAGVPPGADHDALSTRLDDLRQRTRDDLGAALPHLGWSSRLSTTAALADLGVMVPHITTVTVTRVESDSHASSDSSSESSSGGDGGRDSQGHGWQIVVTGSGFAPGALVVVDGQPVGTPVSASGMQLVALVSDDVGARAQSVGVLNPDDTAAATSAITRHNGGGDDGHPTATPSVSPNATASPTATPHGGHGDH
jgi:hypothetical protein